MKWTDGMWTALSTYSRLPARRVAWSEDSRRYALCFFPLVGACAGIALAAWLLACDALRLGALLRGAVGCAIPLMVSGGIHMDGFMDTCDALASHAPRERKLQIMKDSHAGAFAVLGCALYLLLHAALLSELSGLRVCIAAGLGCVLSRALSGLALLALPGARPGGLLDAFSSSADRHCVRVVLALWLVAALGVLLALGWAYALSAALACAACLLWYRRMALSQFGGLTGDLAGWFVQICELAVALSALIAGRLC